MKTMRRSDDLQLHCRTCFGRLPLSMESSAGCYHIYQIPSSLTKLLISCTALDINDDKDAAYPQRLCSICYDTLQDFQRFRRMAQQTAEMLQEMLNDNEKLMEQKESLCTDTDGVAITNINTHNYEQHVSEPLPVLSDPYCVAAVAEESFDSLLQEMPVFKVEALLGDTNESSGNKHSSNYSSLLSSSSGDGINVSLDAVGSSRGVKRKRSYVFQDSKPLEQDNKHDLYTALSSRMDRMEENMTTMLNRVLNEVTLLRHNHNSAVQNELQQSRSTLPANPFDHIEDFLKFSNEIERSEEVQRLLVSELVSIICTNTEKFVRTCWRKILTDKVAEHFSWRGTSVKRSIRDMGITLAIRKAFRQKYTMDDDAFDRVCQKHFQYAHDRQIKINNYHKNKII